MGIEWILVFFRGSGPYLTVARGRIGHSTGATSASTPLDVLWIYQIPHIDSNMLHKMVTS